MIYNISQKKIKWSLSSFFTLQRCLKRRGCRIEAAVFDRIALYRSITEWRWLSEYHVLLLLIACGTNSELSCSARSGLRHPFRSLFFVPSPSLRRESIGDSRGYKKWACRGLFRDRGSFDFRETREESRNRRYKPLREVGGDTRNIRKRYPEHEARNRAFESPVAANVWIAAFVHFKGVKRALSVVRKFCLPITFVRVASVRNSHIKLLE